MSVCINCEHRVSLHSGDLGCTYAPELGVRVCGCAWYEEGVAEAPPTLAVAVAKPGDTVLIGLNTRYSDEEYEILVDHLQPLKRELGIRIGIIEDVSSMIVVRSGEGAP